MLLYNGFFFLDLEPSKIDWTLILKIKNTDYKYIAEITCESVNKKSFSENFLQDFVFIKPHKIKQTKSLQLFIM